MIWSKEDFETIIKQKGKVLYLIGRPGIGKSAVIKKITKQNEWQFFDIRLSQIDSSEVLGIPRFAVDDTGVEYMKYALPDWAYLANQQPSLIFFDEINRARLDVRNAALQILLDRQIGHKFQFNDNVYFACAGNLGEEDNCDVDDLDSALQDRLATVKFEPTVNQWISDFAEKNINSYIINFLKNKSDHYYKYDEESPNFATPRSWTHLSNLIGKDNTNIDSISQIVSKYGILYIGKSTSIFLNYLEDINVLRLKDILNRYDQVEDKLKKLPRDRISEFMQELQKFDLTKLTKKQYDNLISFINIVHADERVGFFSSLMDNNLYYTYDTEKKDIVSYNGEYKWNYLKDIIQKFSEEFFKIYSDEEEKNEEKNT